MKLAEGYLVKEVAGSFVLIPVGQNVIDYRNILSTNKTGDFILGKLAEDISNEELFSAVCLEYTAEEKEKEQVKQDLDEFLLKLREKNLLCE
ncbi:MAG TPA: PqqD family protein [Lachnospiraceae bacterium]|nr:PqqD family protein [Lachnospiraceae bacterium]